MPRFRDDVCVAEWTGGGPQMSRGQLLEQVLGFAATLRAYGLMPGDVVNIADTNTVRVLRECNACRRKAWEGILLDVNSIYFFLQLWPLF